MTSPITLERWKEAQIAEHKHHADGVFVPDMSNPTFSHYHRGYTHYFRYLGMSFDLQGKSVIEIGPAKAAALGYCENLGKCYIIEPTVWPDTLEFYKSKGITMIHEPAETAKLPVVDEVWILNLLQHVIDPALIVKRCMEVSKTIRFFEPIDTPANDAHPHVLTRDFFVSLFGNDVVKDYVGGSAGPGFHGANCCYGVYTKP